MWKVVDTDIMFMEGAMAFKMLSVVVKKLRNRAKYKQQ
jgi:hypothetical protein